MKAKKGSSQKRRSAAVPAKADPSKARTKALAVRNASAIRGGDASPPVASAAKITLKLTPEYTRFKKGSGTM